jgi:hypothetical protein
MIFHRENIGKREKLSVDRGAIYARGVCYAAICMSVCACARERAAALVNTAGAQGVT